MKQQDVFQISLLLRSIITICILIQLATTTAATAPYRYDIHENCTMIYANDRNPFSNNQYNVEVVTLTSSSQSTVVDATSVAAALSNTDNNKDNINLPLNHHNNHNNQVLFRLMLPPLLEDKNETQTTTICRHLSDSMNAGSIYKSNLNNYNDDIGLSVPTALFLSNGIGNDPGCTLNDLFWNILQLNVNLPVTSSIQFFVLPSSPPTTSDPSRYNATTGTSADTAAPPPMDYYHDDISIIYVQPTDMARLQLLISDTASETIPSPYLFHNGSDLWDFNFILLNSNVIQGMNQNNYNSNNNTNNINDGSPPSSSYHDYNNRSNSILHTSNWFGIFNLVFVIILTLCLMRSYCIHRQRLYEIQVSQLLALQEQQQQQQSGNNAAAENRNDTILTLSEFNALPLVPYTYNNVPMEAKQSNHADSDPTSSAASTDNNITYDDVHVESNAIRRDASSEVVESEEHDVEDDDIEIGGPSKQLELSNDNRNSPQTSQTGGSVVSDVECKTSGVGNDDDDDKSVVVGQHSENDDDSNNTFIANTDNNVTKPISDTEAVTSNSNTDNGDSNVTTTTTVPPMCTSCSICIDDFMLNEMIVVLPRCNHSYHKDCIKQWLLEKQGCCPLCKTDVLNDEQKELRRQIRMEQQQQNFLLQQQQLRQPSHDPQQGHDPIVPNNNNTEQPRFIVVIDPSATRRFYNNQRRQQQRHHYPANRPRQQQPRHEIRTNNFNDDDSSSSED